MLVTLDEDFGELAIPKGQLHAGIVRLVGMRAMEQGRTTVEVLTAHGDDLLRGALVVVAPGRVRVRLA